MSATPAIVYATRICDSETMTNKLIYQIRQNQLTPAELNNLQARCNHELSELRQELNELLSELRAIATKHTAPQAPAASHRAA